MKEFGENPKLSRNCNAFYVKPDTSRINFFRDMKKLINQTNISY